MGPGEKCTPRLGTPGPSSRMIVRRVSALAAGGRPRPSDRVDSSASAGLGSLQPTGRPGNHRPMERATVANRWNLDLIEDYYDRWRKDPASVEESWRNFFEGYELGHQTGGPARRGRRPRRGAGPGGRHPADRRLPRVRPLPGRPRPAQAHPPPPVARAAGAVGLRADRGRPRPCLLQPGQRPAGGCLDPARGDRGPARDVLPDDRRRVHAHPRHGRSQMAAGADGADPQPAGLRHPQEAADHLQAQRGRAVRDVPPPQLRGAEAVLARGRRDADPAAGRDHRAGRLVRGRARDRHGDAAPGSAQRAGQHPRQALRHDLQRVRGQPARDRGRRRRREVSPGLLRRPRHGRQADGPPDADAQPQPPGGRQPGGRGPDAGQAAAVPGQGPAAGPADPDPRRRRLRRPGAGRRDAQPLAAPRLQDRRHDPHRGEQPDRLHHRAQRGPLDPVLHRRRQDDRGADLPRQRRGPRGRRRRRRAGAGLPPDLRQGRRHRHGLLPAARAQRGRRAGVHPAPDVREDQEPDQHPRAVYRAARDERRAVQPGGRDDRRDVRGEAAGGLRGSPARGRRAAGRSPASRGRGPA